MLTTLPRLNKILAIAESYNGMRENSDEHHYLVDFYNTISPLPRGYHLKYSDSWCAAYVSVVMRRSGILEFPYECGVFEMFNRLKERGCIIYGRPPMPGEILFFKSSHVGIVNGWMTQVWECPTIEGNSADMCTHRTHFLKDENILGWTSPYRYTTEEIKLQIEGGVWGSGDARDYMLLINNYAS